MGFLGYRGLALGTALAATLNAALLLWILRARLGGLEGRRTTRTLMSVLVASTVMAAAVWLVEWLLESAFPGTRTLVRAVRVFLAIGTGVIVLAGCARVLGIEELDDVVRRVSGAARGRHV